MKPPLSRYIALAQRRTMALMSRRGPLLKNDLFGGVKARVTASLGVSLFPDDAGDAGTLMAHADKAMYMAKRAGKNAFCVFSAGGTASPASIPSSDHRAA